MTISKETKVGIFALVSFVILYLGFNFLKGKDFFSSQNKYTVIYDNVEGLTVANQVSVSGMKVGAASRTFSRPFTRFPNSSRRMPRR